MRKAKPNALKAGIEPITSEVITPAKDQTARRRPRPGQEVKARIAAPGAARGLGSRDRSAVAFAFGQGDIGHKIGTPG